MSERMVYEQSTGRLLRNGQLYAQGWAGRGKGKNNPAMQDVRCTGPLPRGLYVIAEPIKHPRLGPCAMKLTPSADNEMFGRDDFWIHGASTNPERHGQESMGCVILSRPDRMRLVESGVRLLEVVA